MNFTLFAMIIPIIFFIIIFSSMILMIISIKKAKSGAKIEKIPFPLNILLKGKKKDLFLNAINNPENKDYSETLNNSEKDKTKIKRFENLQYSSKPPRKIPLSTLLLILFGGGLNLFGWVFMTFGLVFCFIFLPNIDYKSLSFNKKNTVLIRGKIIEVKKTSFSEGGGSSRRGRSHRSGTPIYAAKYQFRINNKIYKNISYVVGYKYKINQKINIEYIKNNPDISRIKNARMAPFKLTTIFVILFPFVGFIFCVVGLFKGIKILRLLKFGVIGWAKLTDKKATSTRVNNCTVYKMTFEYIDKKGVKNIFNVKTHKTIELEDEENEPVLFSPTKSNYAILLDNLPLKLQFDKRGNIQSSNFFKALICFFLPVASITLLTLLVLTFI